MSSQSDLTDGHKKMVLNTKGPLTLVLLMEVSFRVYPPFTGFLLPSLNEKKKTRLPPFILESCPEKGFSDIFLSFASDL